MKKIALIAIAFFPLPSFPCAMCAFSLVDQICPPVFLWCGIASVWLILTAFNLKKDEKKLLGRSPIPFAITIVLLSSILAVGFIGPIPYLLIIPYCLALTVSSIFSKDMKTRIISRLTLLVFLIATAYSIFYSVKRTNVDYIIQWSGTAGSDQAIKEIKRHPATAITQYRELLNRSNGLALKRTATEMIGMAKPDEDVPLLIAALDRSQKNSEKSYVIDSIEDSLTKITGFDLPKGSSAKEWQSKWRSRKES